LGGAGTKKAAFLDFLWPASNAIVREYQRGAICLQGVAILFLGDKGHHQPEQRFKQVQDYIEAPDMIPKRKDVKPLEYVI
jgi:hypothetical protein